MIKVFPQKFQRVKVWTTKNVSPWGLPLTFYNPATQGWSKRVIAPFRRPAWDRCSLHVLFYFISEGLRPGYWSGVSKTRLGQSSQLHFPVGEDHDLAPHVHSRESWNHDVSLLDDVRGPSCSRLLSFNTKSKVGYSVTVCRQRELMPGEGWLYYSPCAHSKLVFYLQRMFLISARIVY